MDYQSLHIKTVAELRQIAKTMKVRIPAGTNKSTLITMLLEAEQASAAQEPVENPAEPSPAEPVQKRPGRPPKQPDRAAVELAEDELPPAADEAPIEETSTPVVPPVEDEVEEKPEAEAKESSTPPQMERPVLRPFPRPMMNNRIQPRPTFGDNRPLPRGTFPNRTPRMMQRPEGQTLHQVSPTVAHVEATREGEASAEAPVRMENSYIRPRREGYYNAEYKTSNPAVPELLATGDCAEGAGVLEIQPDGYGFLRAENCLPGPNDVYVSIAQIRRFELRNGDYVVGKTRPQREGDRYSAMLYITSINGLPPEDSPRRPRFEDLIPIYPDQRLRLEPSNADGHGDFSLRLIDMLAPIGKGQRGMIVSQPKAGKTTLLKKIANAISAGYPEIELIVLLIDERPEEVTDMKRSIKGEVIYSTFDEAPENHIRVSEMVLERAQRMVEAGKDVVVLMDSITRLARAYNLVITPTGRSLSGGLDPGALFKPKRFFGAARNIENGGSLTVIATALVETGSRMDDIIFEEFKGTGNMEVHLDRKLSDKRVFPAIDMLRSGTRREELLLSEAELDGEMLVRRVLSGGKGQDMPEQVISLMSKTSTNAEFFEKLKGWINVFEKDGYSLGNAKP